MKVDAHPFSDRFATSNVVVIYHGSGCLDGFGSAVAADAFFSARNLDVTYFAARHDEPPPELRGKHVFMLDFAYRREVMTDILAEAATVTVLDHHITAVEQLGGLEGQFDNIYTTLDMGRSGCVISWEYFHEVPVPWLLKLIEDRDLWRFRYPETKAVNMALMSYPLTFAGWQAWLGDKTEIEGLVHEGETLLRFRAQLIDHYKSRAFMGEIAGYRVPVVNAPPHITSELLNDLAAGQPFAAAYNDSLGKRGWSLRSREDGVNVAEVAAKFGGGGHPRAAGFATALDNHAFKLDV